MLNTAGLPMALHVVVINYGLKPLAGSCSLFQDIDRDSVPANSELMGLTGIPAMPPGDSMEAEWRLPSLPVGTHQFIARLQDDDNPANNTRWVRWTDRTDHASVVINEIMFNPDSDCEPEWLELYNRGNTAIDVGAWRYGDAVGSTQIARTEQWLPSHRYAILTEDSTFFRSRYGARNCLVMQPVSWQRLNNDGDHLVLMDELGGLVDAVPYHASWMVPRNNAVGVSLERIDPYGPSGTSDNWWAASAPTGATPGTSNSVAQTGTAGGTERVWATPDPFSPDGDGFDDRTDIFYEASQRSLVTVEIFDAYGRKMRTLLKQKPVIGSGSVRWDGTTDEGRKVRLGIYVLGCTFRNLATDATLVRKKTVVVAQRLH
jgi:hypothetical protein